jgi:hypothetical protein
MQGFFTLCIFLLIQIDYYGSLARLSVRVNSTGSEVNPDLDHSIVSFAYVLHVYRNHMKHCLVSNEQKIQLQIM